MTFGHPAPTCDVHLFVYTHTIPHTYVFDSVKRIVHAHNRKKNDRHTMRGGGLGSRPNKLYGESLGDGVEYHLMSPTPRR